MATYNITTAQAPFEFEVTLNGFNSCFIIDANHFINFWVETGTFAQVFTVNTTTWAITTAAASLGIDTSTTDSAHNSCWEIDANHFINFSRFFTGAAYRQHVTVLTVNTTTWAISTNSQLTHNNGEAGTNSCYKVDTNHFIDLFVGANNDLYAQVFTVNTTTWAVTTAATELTLKSGTINSIKCYKVDTNHFLAFYFDQTAGDTYASVLTVNTTTWAVTTAGAEFDTGADSNDSFFTCYAVDANHFITFAKRAGGATGQAQVFAVNTTTWEITTAGALFEFDAVSNANNSCFLIQNADFVNFWAGDASDGYVQVFTVNTSTWAVTTSSSAMEFDTTSGQHNSCYKIDTSHYINFWKGVDGDGFTQVFIISEVASGPANLKSYNTNLKANIKSINTNLIANVKTLDTNV